MDVLFPAVCKFNKCNFRTQISLIKLPKTFLTLQKFQNLSRAAPIKVFLWPGNFYLLCPCHVEPGLKFSIISPDNIVTDVVANSDQTCHYTSRKFLFWPANYWDSAHFFFWVREQFFLGSNIFPVWNIKIRILFEKKGKLSFLANLMIF